MTHQQFEKAGGQAFPDEEQNTGISVRDYFAAKAMQALLGNEATLRQYAKSIEEDETKGSVLILLTDDAYDIADCMLEKREEEE